MAMEKLTEEGRNYQEALRAMTPTAEYDMSDSERLGMNKVCVYSDKNYYIIRALDARCRDCEDSGKRCNVFKERRESEHRLYQSLGGRRRKRK